MSSANKIRHVKEKQQFSDDVNQEIDFINSLDYYSLKKIFMLLPICDRINMKKVSTKWREELCGLAWYNIKKYKCSRSIGCAYDDQLLTESYVESLVSIFGVHLRKLILSKIFTSSIMSIIGEHCQNLTRLDFVVDENLPVNTDNYIQAFTKLNKIKFIKIFVIYPVFEQDPKFKTEILCCLPEEINEIHVIFEKNDCLKTPCFFDLKKFKNLEGLTLSGCDLDHIIHQISEKITLVYLNLKHSWISPRLFLHASVETSFNKLVNLKYIHLFEEFNGVSPNFVKGIFNTCKNLRYFNVSESSSHRLPASIENWENHNNLEYLAMVQDLNYDSAVKMVKYCNNLKCLTFKKEVRETVLQKLTELKNLESLEFYVSHDLSDESILAISNNCKKLKHLEILYEHRTYFSDIEYEDDDADYDDDYDEPAQMITHYTIFDELSKLEYLESLNVLGVHEFIGRSMIAVANKCKSLKYLNISYCKYITETGLNAITSMESLQKLNVSNVESVTDSFIIKLKGLTSFEATRCKNITDSGIIQFIKNCPDLEDLHLFNTNMTVNTIMAADQETKYRKNDIILHIHCGRRVLEESCKPIIKSKWLVVHYDTQIFICDF